MSGGRETGKGSCMFYGESTNPGGIIKKNFHITSRSLWNSGTSTQYCGCTPSYLFFSILYRRFITSTQPRHVKPIHYRLKCHPLLPITLHSTWKITLTELCWHVNKRVSLDVLIVYKRTSLTFWRCVGLLCTSKDNRIQQNRKGPWFSVARHREQILGRDWQWGLETSSSSVRSRHPVTADFILEVPLGKK